MFQWQQVRTNLVSRWMDGMVCQAGEEIISEERGEIFFSNRNPSTTKFPSVCGGKSLFLEKA